MKILLSCWLVLLSLAAEAAIESYPFSDQQTRERFQSITQELRCPKCQNQNIADSNAEIAQDLRKKVFQMLERGRSDQEIYAYMTERYGDFVLYQPPVEQRTWALWFAPVAILLLGLLTVVWISRVRSRAASSDQSLAEAEQQRLNRLLEQDQDR
ncbi:MAG: cytochrome c-type biogenesis protein [Methylococcales bacterium]|nr:cytochrome c-type biogenesis protein [Methylococcales bacterium]